MTEDGERKRTNVLCIKNLDRIIQNTPVADISQRLLEAAKKKGCDECWISYDTGHERAWLALMGSRPETDDEMKNRQWLEMNSERRAARAKKKKLEEDKKLYNKLKKRFG